MMNLCGDSITIIFLGLILLFYLIFDYIWIITKLINIKKWVFLECNIKTYELKFPKYFRGKYNDCKVIGHLRNIRIIYQYSYDGVPYSNNRISLEDYLLTSGNYNEERMRIINSGLLTRCYVNPNNPEESILFSGVNKISLRCIEFLIILLFSIVFISILYVVRSSDYLFPMMIFKLAGYSFIASSIIWILLKRYARGVVNSNKSISSEIKAIHEKTDDLKRKSTYEEFKVGLGFLLAPIVLAAIHFTACFLAH